MLRVNTDVVTGECTLALGRSIQLDCCSPACKQSYSDEWALSVLTRCMDFSSHSRPQQACWGSASPQYSNSFHSSVKSLLSPTTYVLSILSSPYPLKENILSDTEFWSSNFLYKRKQSTDRLCLWPVLQDNWNCNQPRVTNRSKQIGLNRKYIMDGEVRQRD